MKNIAILTGAGVSAESGIKTFRDADGLWEGHDVMAVATPQGWAKNQALVTKFYNERRAQLKDVLPNDAHKALVELEAKYNTVVITQNVDDLHERAGTKRVVHLHGELRKVRSTVDESLVYEWKEDVKPSDTCEKGSTLRPHVVWFGEAVPMLGIAEQLVSVSDIVIIIGTSMQVYPAAGLVHAAKPGIPIYFVDPKPTVQGLTHLNLKVFEENASSGVRKVVDELLQKA